MEAKVFTPKSVFETWPLDLLLDYVLKTHHRNFHRDHAELLALVNKVARDNGTAELAELARAVGESFAELDEHFWKEENILFPYLYELTAAEADGRTPAQFHCGTIQGPIRQMLTEHDDTTGAWEKIGKLTNNYETPAEASDEYREAMSRLSQFHQDLREHIMIENDYIFPGYAKLEMQMFGAEYRIAE